MRSGLVARLFRYLSIVAGCALAFWGTTSFPGLTGSENAPARVSAQAAPRNAATTAGAPIHVLFLGQEQATHSASAIYQTLAPALARRGIQLTTALTPDDALT